MLIALLLSFKGLHMLSTLIFENFGLLGSLAAVAICYRVGVAIDR